MVTGIFQGETGEGAFAGKRHAAEDIGKLPGTPVYAIADGIIRFSGRKAGYGWLIIIDHPQEGVYSLYGHLSPSRWRQESGEVEKGDLIAYVGDETENGSSAKYGTMYPHLHFGVRAGKKSDYFGNGDARWTASWTVACPEDRGWIQPSSFILGRAQTEGVATASLPSISPLPRYVKFGLLTAILIGLCWHIASGLRMGQKLWDIESDLQARRVRYVPWWRLDHYRRAMARGGSGKDRLFYVYVVSSTMVVLATEAFILLFIL